MPAREYPTIVAIIAVAVAVFVIEQAKDINLAPDYGTVPAKIVAAWDDLAAGNADIDTAAALARLFTSLFVHAGPEHILYNMVFLWAFGCLTSEHLGKWWALVIFLVTGAGGDVLQIALNPDSQIPIVGASGAICGFEGVYLGLALRWTLRWPDVWPLAHPIPPLQLCAFAVIGIGFDFYALMNHGQRIAYGAHVGGFITGLILAGVVTQIYHTREAYWGEGRGE